MTAAVCDKNAKRKQVLECRKTGRALEAWHHSSLGSLECGHTSAQWNSDCHSYRTSIVMLESLATDACASSMQLQSHTQTHCCAKRHGQRAHTHTHGCTRSLSPSLWNKCLHMCLELKMSTVIGAEPGSMHWITHTHTPCHVETYTQTGMYTRA